jgi:hypothetical protein
VNEASVSTGDDGSGIRPATSLATRPRLAGGTSRTEKEPVLIRRWQEHRGWSWNGICTGVTCATSGLRPSVGSGLTVYTMAS